MDIERITTGEDGSVSKSLDEYRYNSNPRLLPIILISYGGTRSQFVGRNEVNIRSCQLPPVPPVIIFHLLLDCEFHIITSDFLACVFVCKTPVYPMVTLKKENHTKRGCLQAAKTSSFPSANLHPLKHLTPTTILAGT